MKSVFQKIAMLICAVALTACGAAANTEKPVVLDPNTQVKEFVFPDLVKGTGTAAAAGVTSGTWPLAFSIPAWAV